MTRLVIKPLTPAMQVAWRSASLTTVIGIAVLLHSAGFSLGDASLGVLLVAAAAFALLSFLLRVFFQQAATPQELMRNFLFRGRR